MWSVSLKIHYTVLTIMMMWDEKTPTWWDEWRRHWVIALSYYWPSDDKSEGGSSAADDPGWSHDHVDGWMWGADNVDGWGNLVFSDPSWPRVTETADMRGLLYINS